MRRIHRLRERRRFQEVRREGKSWAEGILVLYALPNGLSHSRFGFSVSKRVGKAVTRNRVRRQMREAVRLRLAGIAPGWDMVFVARSSVVSASYVQIDWACERVLSRAHLLAPGPAPSEETA